MTSGGGAGTQSQDKVAEVPEPSPRLRVALSAKPNAIVTNQVPNQDLYLSKCLGLSLTPAYFPARRTAAKDQLERSLERQKRGT